MHGGPLEPSAHLFSFGTWCKGNERTRVRGLSCTKSEPVPTGARLGRRPVTPTPTPAGGSTSPGPTPAASHFGQQPYRPPAVSPPQQVVESTHMSTFIFFRIIIKFIE